MMSGIRGKNTKPELLIRKALHARGVKDVEMGWILEDNDGMRNIIETIGGKAYKRYRVYQKEL